MREFDLLISNPPHEVNSERFLGEIMDGLPRYPAISFSFVNLTIQGMENFRKNFWEAYRCDVQSAFKYYISIRGISDDSDALAEFLIYCNLLANKHKGKFENVKVKYDSGLNLLYVESIYVFSSDDKI